MKETLLVSLMVALRAYLMVYYLVEPIFRLTAD